MGTRQRWLVLGLQDAPTRREPQAHQRALVAGAMVEGVEEFLRAAAGPDIGDCRYEPGSSEIVVIWPGPGTTSLEGLTIIPRAMSKLRSSDGRPSHACWMLFSRVLGTGLSRAGCPSALPQKMGREPDLWIGPRLFG
jgi:hypothetical protein